MAAADVLHLTGRVATELSGGERARVLLARALSVEAPVLIIDEPLAALDPGHQLQTMALLRRLAGAGRLVMVVMHELGMASRFCDRLLQLSEWRLASDGASAAGLTGGLSRAVYVVGAFIRPTLAKRYVFPWCVTCAAVGCSWHDTPPV